MYTGEMFKPSVYEQQIASEGNGVDITLLKPKWEEKLKKFFHEATLPFPEKIFQQTGGKEGIHTEHLGYILADLQFLQRAYPGCEW